MRLWEEPTFRGELLTPRIEVVSKGSAGGIESNRNAPVVKLKGLLNGFSIAMVTLFMSAASGATYPSTFQGMAQFSTKSPVQEYKVPPSEHEKDVDWSSIDRMVEKYEHYLSEQGEDIEELLGKAVPLFDHEISIREVSESEIKQIVDDEIKNF